MPRECFGLCMAVKIIVCVGLKATFNGGREKHFSSSTVLKTWVEKLKMRISSFWIYLSSYNQYFYNNSGSDGCYHQTLQSTESSPILSHLAYFTSLFWISTYAFTNVCCHVDHNRAKRTSLRVSRNMTPNEC